MYINDDKTFSSKSDACEVTQKTFLFFITFLFVVIEQIMKTKYTEFLLLAALDQNVCHGKEKSSH